MTKKIMKLQIIIIMIIINIMKLKMNKLQIIIIKIFKTKSRSYKVIDLIAKISFECISEYF